jgi:class 3 adenylate cyclase
MCVELRRANDGHAVADSQSDLIHDLSDEEDPSARSLAALVRVTELCAEGSEGWAPETMHICRELVEAGIAAYVAVDHDGGFQTPIVVPPDAQRRTESPVLWPVVRHVLASKQSLFCRDVVADGVVESLDPTDARAVMASPVALPDGSVVAVLYLSRAQATSAFSTVEFDTLKSIALVVGMRLDRERQRVEMMASGTGADVAGVAPAAAHASELAAQALATDAERARLADRLTALEAEHLAFQHLVEVERHNTATREADRDHDVAQAAQATYEARLAAQRDKATADQERAAIQQELASMAHRALNAEAERTSLETRVADLQGQMANVLEANRRDLELVAGAKRREVETIAGLETLQADLARSVADRESLMTTVKTLHVERAQTADALELAQAQAHAQVALRQAMRTSVLPSIVDHVEAIAAGDTIMTTVASRAVTVAYIALADFDAWCERANADHVKAHLNTFCSTIASRARANGGRVDQVIGHGHLVVFPADPAGARAAVRCAIEVAGVVAADADDAGIADAPSVVAGLHSGSGVVGFFGDEGCVSYVEAGLPFVIARAAVDYAPKGPGGGAQGVLVSDAVRAMLAGEVGFRVTRLDPSWIRGVNAPVQLALVNLDFGGEQ